MTVPNPVTVTPRECPPIRQSPEKKDYADGQRVAYAWSYWDGQTGALLLRDRQIEENVRMLCGQQDIYWSNSSNRFVDPSQWMSQDEQRWRSRPRLNRLLPWYLQTKARMCENPPVLTFVPGPDAVDAELAETMDILFKAQWRELGMADVHSQIAGWMTVGGRAYCESRIDATQGPPKPWIGEGQIPVVNPATGDILPNPETGEPWLVTVPNLPLDQEGIPLAVMVPDPNTGELVPHATGEAHEEPEGLMVPEALSPLECRGEWGPSPWHQKTWHAKRSFLTVDQVKARYGVMVQPDTDGASDGTGILQRMMFGNGYFGSASQRFGAVQSGGVQSTNDKFVETLTFWEKPDTVKPGYAQTKTSPGGRMLVVTRTAVLWDSVRPLAYPFTSPIRCFDFLQIPGRPSGTTPQEFLNPIQRAYNRMWGSVNEHSTRMTNPIMLVDKSSGLASTEVTNLPGQKYEVVSRPGVDAISYVKSPDLGKDVYEAMAGLRKEFDDIGNLNNAPAQSQNKDISGEAIKEWRFDADRYIGDTMRRWVEEYGRMAQDWMVMFPVLWPTEKIIRYAGEDYVARTLTVLPMMFEQGTVNVQPDVESMLPEGRGERQTKVHNMYLEGLFGLVGSPSAIKTYMDLARFPNLARTARPGGANRVTAEQLLGKMIEGDVNIVTPQPSGLPQLWYPWYDPSVHLGVLEDYMSSPAFLKLGEQIKQILGVRWAFVVEQLQAQMVQTAPPPMAGGPKPSEAQPEKPAGIKSVQGQVPPPASSRGPSANPIPSH